MTTQSQSAQAPYWSLPGLVEGAWRTAPLLPGTVVFAFAFGTIAAQKGLSLGDTVLMNALVFAGAAQLVAIEVWTNPMTLGTVASIAALTAIVNARFVLMGASLRPWMGSMPAWQVYPPLLLTTDATCIVGMRSEEHTTELQSLTKLVCRLLLGKKSEATVSSVFGFVHHPNATSCPTRPTSGLLTTSQAYTLMLLSAAVASNANV